MGSKRPEGNPYLDANALMFLGGEAELERARASNTATEPRSGAVRNRETETVSHEKKR